jgi:hypothetical protein
MIGDWIELIETARMHDGRKAAPVGRSTTLQQVHLINLDRSIERLAKFRENNPHLDAVIRVSAIDGS